MQNIKIIWNILSAAYIQNVNKEFAVFLQLIFVEA
jgi:hypothetical protein